MLQERQPVKNSTFKLFILGFAGIGIIICSPFLGMDFISPWQIFSDPFASRIFFTLRLPRVLMAFLAGGGLALCGLVYQAMFRNPLADPFTLGISSGASCGAAATILFGLNSAVLGLSTVTLGAFAGAILAMGAVIALGSLQRSVSSLSVLLAGIAVSFFFSSILMFLQFISPMRESFAIVRWLMGGIDVFGFGNVGIAAIFVLGGATVVFVLLRALDMLYSGEDVASTRGVNVVFIKRILLVATVFMVGSIVALCGPIGFVGLMAPHFCKMLFPMNHRTLGPATFVSGGAFLVLCDTLGRTIIAPAEMPVGVITALVGAPAFVYLLMRNVKRGG